MTLTETYKEELITIRALGLFFYNFRMDAINKLCKESSDFKRMWDNLYATEKRRHEEEGGMFTIEHENIYDKFFTKLSYKTQALVIQTAKEIHGEEARSSVELTIKTDGIQRITKKRT